MKKFTSFLIVALLRIAFCFSQSTGVTDPYTGIHMKPDPEKKFLEVTSFRIGSPADLSGLRTGDRIYQINGEKVSVLSDPFNAMKNAGGSWIRLSVQRIGKGTVELEVPRVSIDLNQGRYRTEGSVYRSTDLRQKVSLSPDNYNLEKKKEEVLEIVNATPDPDMYIVYDVFGGVGCDYRLNADNATDAVITLLGDNTRDMTGYKTYGFDFLSQDDPLTEKTLAGILEGQLNGLGLMRNQDNPDLLIILNFYSGQKDNFVPPQQIISTKIKTVFNWYWGYVPVPVTESRTQAGYTQMTYLANINVKFLDAREIETSKTPPIVWSGSISQISQQKIFLSEQAQEFFTMALSQFPLVWQPNSENYMYNHYAYSGIIYDVEDPKTIADVIPGSPAAVAGIQKGDKILGINGKAPTFSGYPIIGSWSGAFAYLYVYSKFNQGVSKLFPSVYSEFAKYTQDGNTVISFDVKRGGKRNTYNITPEDKTVVFFNATGTTLN
jgi:hypothetical protein